MGNAESIANDIVNNIVDTGYKIADGGTTAINEIANKADDVADGFTNEIIIPIVNKIDESKTEEIKQFVRRKPVYVKPPKQPNKKYDIKKDIINPIQDNINNIVDTNKILNDANKVFNDINKGFNDFGNQLNNNLNIGGGSSNNKNNNSNEYRNYTIDEPIDETTMYIIIGSLILVGYLIIK